MRTKWTDDEISKLTSIYPSASREEILRELGRSWASIKVKAKRLMLHRTPEAERVQRSASAKLTIKKKKYPYNEDYFKHWSRNMAYIFGFWFADGYINISRAGGKTVGFTISQRDEYFLHTIMDQIGKRKILHNNKDNTAILRYFGDIMFADIIKLGGKTRKSLDKTFPFIPEEFLFDFIRGYVDGNGSIQIVKDNRADNTYNLRVRIYSGSKVFLEGMLSRLQPYISGVSDVKKTQHCHCISITRYQSLKSFFHRIYDGAELYLTRKYNRFTSAINFKEDVIHGKSPNYSYFRNVFTNNRLFP